MQWGAWLEPSFNPNSLNHCAWRWGVRKIGGYQRLRTNACELRAVHCHDTMACLCTCGFRAANVRVDEMRAADGQSNV